VRFSTSTTRPDTARSTGNGHLSQAGDDVVTLRSRENHLVREQEERDARIHLL
jgi:hypothetical protein